MKRRAQSIVLSGQCIGARVTVAVAIFALVGCRQAAAPTTASRDAIRAYYGAPPVIPHPVRVLGRSNCLACHDEGLQPVAGAPAVPKPHATLGECRQCHVEQNRNAPLIAQNTFVGLGEPREHQSAYDGAPPTIPHRLWLRENCLACHGPRGHPEMHTTHPERSNCTQCHVIRQPDAEPFVANLFALKGGKTR